MGQSGRATTEGRLLKVLACVCRLGFAICCLLAGFEFSSGSAADPNGGLRLPVACIVGTECFVQQMPDIDPSPSVLDPLCGLATHQGHDGWDIRLRSLREIAQDVPVLAVADGRVARTRDGVADRLYDDIEDKARIAEKECGNGVLIEHGSGLGSQYCHLKNGSLLVTPGAQVQKGQRIGAIGSSGLAQFPHVHLAVRRDGSLIEPLTGRLLGDANPACGEFSSSLFEPAAVQALERPSVAILDYGLADTVPNLPDLIREGAPPTAKSRGLPMVAWVWAINVEAGYRFRIRLVGPDETVLVDHTTNALEKRKANYLAYVGRKAAVRSGSYKIYVEIRNGDQSIQSRNGLIAVSE
jgi:murein DD-endopeptidase MepM/ murein hydrolase activator NlpD